MKIFENVYTELTSTQRLTSSSNPREFRRWKTKISFVLFDNGVEYVLKSPKPPTPDENSTPESINAHEKWVSDDDRCRSLMLLTMDDLLLRLYDHSKTAKAMMDKLTQSFVQTSLAYRCNLYEKYTQKKMTEETDINDHLNEMCGLAYDVDYAGMPVPEAIRAVVIVNSLPESWDSVLKLIMINGNGDVGLNDLMRHLRLEGNLRRMRGEEEAELPKKKQRTGNRGFRGNCYACGKPGHCQSVCPDK